MIVVNEKPPSNADMPMLMVSNRGAVILVTEFRAHLLSGVCVVASDVSFVGEWSEEWAAHKFSPYAGVLTISNS